MEVPIWVTVLSSLALGGIASVLISGRINNQLKQREQYFEMAKHKLEIMSKALPNYTRLGSYYDELSDHLSYGTTNLDRAFYCASRIIYLEREVFEGVGTIQLDSLEAEEILSSLELDLEDYEMRDRMRYLAEIHPTYKEFLECDFDYSVFEKFKTKFLEEKKKPANWEYPNLQQKCNWYSHLMFLEINEVYSIWYGTHPVSYARKLPHDLKKYLLNIHPDYYDRVYAWEIGKRLWL